MYPAGTKAADMLAAYTRLFPIVEIDSSYYGVPAPATVASWNRRTPHGFRFTAKLPGTVTHVTAAAPQAGLHADIFAFRTAFEPLLHAGKFACALAQFPNSFRPAERTERYLRALCDALEGFPLVAEFRHREWQTHDTLALLGELRVGLVAVDEPQFTTLLRPSTDVTAPLAYVRFHGRNYERWWKGDNVTRYDYSYSAEELGPWADRLVDFAANAEVKEVLAFFNNHRRGQAARNARMFEAMLATRFPPGTVRSIAPPNDPLRNPEPPAAPTLELF